MNLPYIIVDDDQESVLKTKAIANSFSELVFVASANNCTDGLNLILIHTPKIIFLEIDPVDKESNLSLALINELYRFLKIIPKIIITTTKKELAFEAIQFEVADYMLKPIQRIDLVKLFFKIKKAQVADIVNIVGESELVEDQKLNTEEYLYLENYSVLEDNKNDFSEEEINEINNPILEEVQDSEVETTLPQFHKKQNPKTQQPLVICIKSYGDYRYIDAKDICYFQADNNSTDIHLNNGEMITAFKTLKHFEGVLSHPFVRIHNSYILNCNYISRIHTGNAVCHIKNSTTKLPFSKSYKPNIDFIISYFSNGNYLEI